MRDNSDTYKLNYLREYYGMNSSAALGVRVLGSFVKNMFSSLYIDRYDAYGT